MNADLRITTLGYLSVWQNGGVISSFPSRKTEALLVYLAVENENAHRRESLCTLLWPGMPEKSARHNLRQVLYELRQVLPQIAFKGGKDLVPLLLVDRQTIQINPQAQVEVDIHTLTRILKATQLHDHLSLISCETCLKDLTQALALYRGDFLRDFYLEDSNEFEEWAEANREEYRDKVLSTLETLTEIFIHKGVYDQARDYADQQLKIDPFREIAFRQLMELLSKSGQRTEAMRAYQQCARVLEIELGTHPSIETTALFEIIRGEDLQKSTPSLREGAIRGFMIREHLGSGHTGTVYKAYQPVIGRDVAIKVILPQFANHPDFIRRFEVEAQLVARLEHPHIVPLYDYWRDPSGAYLVMRWLKGGNLQTDLARGPWKPASAVELVDQITTALALAHRQGIVHCDIKPANILLDEEGNGYLTDFGIAILTGPLARLSQSLNSDCEGSSPGSLGYSSPETARGLKPTPLADIYSLGVVLFELLCGAHPFPGVEGEALVQKHLTEPIPSVLLFRPELPAVVDEVIQKATQKDPAQRYQDVETLAREFRLALIPKNVPVSEISDTKVIARNPYKGLRPFKEADAGDFFGREGLVARLLDKFSPSDSLSEPAHFLAVVGPSGSGKSSVIKAGLIPAIRQGTIPGSDRWFIAEMSPGTHPLEELETALLRIAMETPQDLLEQLSTDPRGFLKVLCRTLPGKDVQVLLVIDQFEELFTLVTEEAERNQFLDMLAEAVNEPRSPLRLVISLRADFYDRPLQHGKFGQLVREATEVVLPLNPEELKRAICGPAERVGVSLEPILVERFLQEVIDQSGALPLLQYALTETFEYAENNRLTLAAYEASGGVVGALGRRAEEIYLSLCESEREITRQLFLRLLTLGEGIEDTRRRVLRSEIDSMVGDQESTITSAINQFGRFRLLTFDHDSATRAPTVELAHEALLREWPRLRSWLDASRADIRTQRLLGAATQDWLAANREPGFLLREARLDQFTSWMEDSNVALTLDEQAFLTASLEARQARLAVETQRLAHEAHLEQRSQRILRVLVGVLGAGFLMAAILSIYAFNQRQMALKQAGIGFAALALQEMETANSERGVLLALAALKEYPYTHQAEAALASAVQDSLPYKRFVDEDGFGFEVHWVEWSPDGKRIALGAAPNERGEHGAIIFDGETGDVDLVLDLVIPNAHGGTPQSQCSVYQIKWSPDGERLALATNSLAAEGEQTHCHYLRIYSAFSGKLLLDLDSQGEFSVDWSPNGNNLITGGENRKVWIWDARTGENLTKISVTSENGWQIFPDTSDHIIAAQYSPDGKYVAALCIGGTLNILDVSTGNITQIFQHPSIALPNNMLYGSYYRNGLSWSPDAKKIATAWMDGYGRVWDVDSGKIVQLLAGHAGNVLDISWSPDSTYLLTHSVDSTARLWLASTGQKVLEVPSTGSGNAAWSPNGKWMTTSTQNGLLAWDISVLPPFVNLSDPIEKPTWLAEWTPDGELFVISGPDGLVINWNGGRKSRKIAPSNGILGLSPDSTRMVASDVSYKNAQIFDLYTGDVLMTYKKTWPEPDGVFVQHAWSNEGDRVASAIYPGWMAIWDPETGQEIARSESVVGTLRPIFSPDDKYIAAALIAVDGDSPVLIIDSLTGETLRKLPSQNGWSCVAIWSPDGKTLAVGYQDGTIKLWNTENWKIKKEFKLHQSSVWDLDWSPNGKRIASGETANSVVYVWDEDSSDIVMTWNLQGLLPSGFQDLDWSPDGQYISVNGSSGMPFFRRVWQSTEDLINYADDCCVWRDLTPEERIQFGLPEKP